MNIVKGFILETSGGGRFAKIQGMQEEIFDNVLLVYPYGFVSNITPDNSSLALVFYAVGSSTNAFAIPYNVLKQPQPEDGEVVIGDFNKSNKITFKKDGSVIIEAGSSKIVIAENGNITTTTPLADFSASVNVATSYKVAGVKVLGIQGATVPAPVGGAIIDAEARTAINAIISRLNTHGIIA